MKFKFGHQKLGIKNSLSAIISGVSISQNNSELETIKNETLKLVLGYSDGLIKNEVVTAGYLDILKFFKQEVLIPVGMNAVRLIRERNKFPTINTAVDSYNIAVAKSFLAIGAHDLDKIEGDVVFDYAKAGEKIPAVNMKNEYAVNEGDYVYRDDEKILAWLDVRDTDLAKITNKTKNILLIAEGTAKTTEEFIFKNLKEACELVIKFCGGKYEIRKVVYDELLAGSENVLEVKKVEKKSVEKKYYLLAKEIHDKLGVPITHPAEKFGDFAVRGDIDVTGLEIIEKVDKVAGFTNVWLKNEVLIEESEKILNDKQKDELKEIGRGKTTVIDYSAPNIAKPFGIGHLRSTNIGQALYNIYQRLGWNCIGDNHLGDWGTQFGKMITAIKHWGPAVAGLNMASISDLEKLYVKFHEEAEKDKTFEEEARAWFAKLENGDVEAQRIWQECVDISMKEFNRVYELLGVKIDNAYGEAFYLPMLPNVIQRMKDKGLTKESQGALIVELEGLPPAMLVKSDGATTYFTRDMATAVFRQEKWNPNLVIYEVGSEQSLHFKQVFAASRLMGWDTEYVHIAHGLIRWKDGKFSTRKGDTIHLSEIIDTAKIQAKKIAPSNSEAEIEAVAIGAIKFNDLMADPKRDIIFDWERVMSMDGNSGPYLQYTYARCQSVLAKAKTNYELRITNYELNNEEKALLRYFYQFSEKIVEAAERFSPAVICEYLLNLARKYNEFYGKHRIIGEPEEEQRLFLTTVTAKIIRDGLTILGIKTLEKM
jgi:arginyl-tRNA synthetase